MKVRLSGSTEFCDAVIQAKESGAAWMKSKWDPIEELEIIESDPESSILPFYLDTIRRGDPTRVRMWLPSFEVEPAFLKAIPGFIERLAARETAFNPIFLGTIASKPEAADSEAWRDCIGDVQAGCVVGQALSESDSPHIKGFMSKNYKIENWTIRRFVRLYLMRNLGALDVVEPKDVSQSGLFSPLKEMGILVESFRAGDTRSFLQSIQALTSVYVALS